MASELAPADFPPGLGKPSTKDQLLAQVKFLDESDSQATSISKRISWILRHGAQKADVAQDAKEKWVKFKDLSACEILKEFSAEDIWKVIRDTNCERPRYEVKGDGDEAVLRSIVKDRKPVKGDRYHFKLDVAIKDDSPTAGCSADYPGFPAQDPQQQWLAMQWNMSALMAMEAWNFAANQAVVRFYGKIKSYNDQKGFGFIDCDATHAVFHRDVFLHKAQKQSLKVGDYVSFLFEFNWEGRPQAKDVQPWNPEAAQGDEVGMADAPLSPVFKPNANNDEWDKRVNKRINAVKMVKEGEKYKAAIERELKEGKKRPTTPDPTDRGLSKRFFEDAIQKWKHNL